MNKYNTEQKLAILTVITLIIGLSIGFYYGGKDFGHYKKGMHKMHDGRMMHDKDMDMADMMSDMNKALIGKTGDDFDKAFLSEMIVHHQGAVQMAELASTNAKHQEIKDLSKAIITAQNKEITDMKSWLAKWYEAETRAETFSGLIESVDTGCFVDAVCSVTVGGKKVIIVTGGRMMGGEQEVGTLKRIDSISDFEKHIGQTATVYAAKTPEGDYTLYGSKLYYVMLGK